jgi:hypothetical protein
MYQPHTYPGMILTSPSIVHAIIAATSPAPHQMMPQTIPTKKQSNGIYYTP